MPPSSDDLPQLQESGAPTHTGLVRHESGATGPQPDFLAPLYRWVEVDRAPVDHTASIRSEMRRIIRRFRRAARTEEATAAVIGGGVAVVIGVVVAYLIG